MQAIGWRRSIVWSWKRHTGGAGPVWLDHDALLPGQRGGGGGYTHDGRNAVVVDDKRHAPIIPVRRDVYGFSRPILRFTKTIPAACRRPLRRHIVDWVSSSKNTFATFSRDYSWVGIDVYVLRCVVPRCVILLLCGTVPHLRIVAQLVELLQAVHDVHIAQLEGVAPLEIEGSSNVVAHPLQLERNKGWGGGMLQWLHQ